MGNYAALTASPMPNGTILLIDDETMLRQAVARTLELEGYTVR